MKALFQIRRIHLAVSLGLALWSTLGYFYVDRYKAIDSFSNDIRLELAAVFWTFLLVLIAQAYWRLSIRKLDLGDLEGKLEGYKRKAIIHYGILELMHVGLVAGYIWGGQQNLLLYSLMGLAYFVYHRPHALKMVKDLQLSDEQEERLRDAFK